MAGKFLKAVKKRSNAEKETERKKHTCNRHTDSHTDIQSKELFTLAGLILINASAQMSHTSRLKTSLFFSWHETLFTIA